jgi:hypothetical protein
VVDEGTTGPADSEPSTDASPAGLYRTASASPIAVISWFAFHLNSTTYVVRTVDHDAVLADHPNHHRNAIDPPAIAATRRM